MRAKTKRFWSLLLAVVMVLTMLPVSALAAGNDAKAIKVTMNSDVETEFGRISWTHVESPKALLVSDGSNYFEMGENMSCPVLRGITEDDITGVTLKTSRKGKVYIPMAGTDDYAIQTSRGDVKIGITYDGIILNLVKKYDVKYSVEGDKPEDCLVPSDARLATGTVVDTETLTTTSNKKGDETGTWTFNGWESKQVNIVDGKFTMPDKDVTIVGSWTFTKKDEPDPDPDPDPDPTDSTEPSKDDVFYYIALPGKTTFANNGDDYRFLTYGGEISKDASRNVMMKLDDEDAIKENIAKWPVGDLKYNTPFQSSSKSVDGGSTWTIDDKGTVTAFKLIIGENTYSNDKEKSTDKCAYGIRWVKFSPSAPSYVVKEDGKDDRTVNTPHLDGMLFKCIDISEIVNPDPQDVTEVLNKVVIEFPANASESEKEFNFELVMLDEKNDKSDAFDAIELTAKVQKADTPVPLKLKKDDNKIITLTPGKYKVYEVMTDEEKAVWQTPNDVTFTVNSNGLVDWKTASDGENITTITNTAKRGTSTDPDEPTKDDVFFFLALPTNTTMSKNPADYRFLTYGGKVKNANDKKELISLANEQAIKDKIKEWPTGDLMTKIDSSYGISSEPVDQDSTWKIESDGTVSSFSIKIGDEIYTNSDYGIRWAKYSYEDTFLKDDRYVSAFHVDGVLYKKIPITDVVKVLYKKVESFPEEVTSGEFNFKLVMLDEEGETSNAFTPIELTATVSTTANPAPLGFSDPKDEDCKLTPGKYKVCEVMDENEDVWQKLNDVTFTVNSDGTVDFVSNTTTITNTAKPKETSGLNDEQIKELLDLQIKVACKNVEENHTVEQFEVVEGSFTVTSDTPTQVTVEITAEQYVDAFSEKKNKAHTLKDNETKTAYLNWNGVKWVVTGVTFDTICESDPKYTVTFEKGDSGSLNGKIRYTEIEENSLMNSVVSVPSVSPNSRYKFTGWLYDGDGKIYSTAEVQKMTVTRNMTFTAQYKKKSSGGGSSSSSKNDKDDDEKILTDDHFAYIVGYTDGTVRPLGSITRSEVAAIYFRLLDEDYREKHLTSTNNFPDVQYGSWYNTSVSTLASVGIITGKSDGLFHPDDPITRAELATIVAKFDKLKQGKSVFSDVSGHWAEEYINSAAAYGWIAGYTDGTFRPNQYITRAEVMTLTNNVLERAVKEKNMHKDMRTWIDNQPGQWYYEAVQEATNSHEYSRTGKDVPGQDFEYENWEDINRDPDWSRYSY